MPIRFLESPQEALATAGEYLAKEPILNNVILTLLKRRAAHPEPGRYWIARDGKAVTGAALQSPLNFSLVLAGMTRGVATALADAISDVRIDLPGASGQVQEAAAFAGRWAERRKQPVRPVRAQRIFEAREVRMPAHVPGLLRQASITDRERVIEWMISFQKENGDGPAEDTQAVADRRITAGEVWLWEKDKECVSMAAMTPAVEGVRRLNYVYTPPGLRRQGFAEACVAGLTARLLDQGFRVMLYAGLENPISNSIYSRIGYRAVFDMMHFRFE